MHMEELEGEGRLIWEKILKQWEKKFTKSLEDESGRFFGAAIIDTRDKGKLVTVDVNSVVAKKDPTAHAEVVALRNGLKKLGTLSYEPYHVLLSTHEPCPMCMGASFWCGISRILYIYSYEDTANQFGVSEDIKLTRALAGGLSHFRTSELLRIEQIQNRSGKGLLDSLYNKTFEDMNSKLKFKYKFK